ncbi:MAG: hypothetical protein M3Y30_12840 [Gemmatimonadota bacterium]|nr:hypothetical protein [Gemmatimonadota bacterium]
MFVPYVSGVALAVAVSAYAMLVGLDRDRAFYPTVLIVVASYYVLFAVMGGDTRTLIEESLINSLFLFVATIGFKRNSWLIVAALAAHGLLDLVHGSVVANAGVPSWWPPFCSAYDVTAAGFLAWTLYRLPILSKPRIHASS